MAFLQPLFLNIYGFLVGSLPSDFFDNQFISYSLDFFEWFGVVIFAFSFLLLISSAVESHAAGEYVNLQMMFSNITKGLLLLAFSRPLVIWSFTFARTVATALLTFTTNAVTLPTLPTGGLSLLWAAIKGTGNLSFVTLIMFVVTIVVFFQLLTLYGMCYVQIVTGYFYIADVMRGNQSAAEDWVRDIAASGITFMLEYIFYIEGIAIMDANYSDLVKCAPGLILIIASPSIPTALRKWGYSHGSSSARGVASGLGSAVTGAASALTHI